jgi:DNA-directed RNA polymerase specialized sigma24 family protein
MVRGAKRRPEQTAADLTENENEWLDEKLSSVANAQHRSAERDLIAADLADRVLGVLSPEDRLALTMIDGDDATIKEVAEVTGLVRIESKSQSVPGPAQGKRGDGKTHRCEEAAGS